ncbi:MAG: glutamine--fructose-6-phosphate transaminase (isomerizing) [Lactobacillaceae bacterium]|jgi:glucosamine--fructose-6-phosphate aminotransferase (isomerizing)|nr:glutamine--fructose-6-phosphate transaminase (isomerizing) [Lactobacillaceae bacterium]
MCGIVGYIGSNTAVSVLIDGLKNLEYRGYDSAGIAMNNDSKINVYRAEGKLSNLCNVLSSSSFDEYTKGIGHIRWATHGAATLDNAHPHKSNDGSVVLVHNGIIENFKELKSELTEKGYNFFSQTDTEAAANYIDYCYKSSVSLEEGVIKAVNGLKGAFAFCIMSENEPDKIIAVRKNAPLIVGLGENENFIASDIPAIIGKVSKIIYLDDGDIATVTKDNIKVKDFAGNVVNKKVETIAFEAEAISKRGYKHFMLKEISEQSDIIRNTLAERLTGTNLPINLAGVKVEEILSKTKRIEIIACGTSLHAAMVAKNIIEAFAGIPVSIEAASEYIYRKNITDAETLVIGISQSGETADTITAIKQAKDKNSHIMVVTNREDSSIVRYADSLLPLRAGIEVSVAATKSYTAQLVSLYLFALKLAEAKKTVDNIDLRKFKQELLEIPAKLEQILSGSKSIKEIADKYYKIKDFFYIARGANVATAMEGALKLKEISYINANGYPAGELKHGPIALLDENVVVMSVLMPNSSTYDKIISNCEEAKARKAKLIAVTSSNDEYLNVLFDEIIKIPEISEELSPILANIPLQLMAYYISDNLGREIDQPRNLAKSVTVE